MGASGCKAICGVLERNTNVVEWRHTSDDFGEEGGRAVARMLERNFTLKSLSINGELALAAINVVALVCGHVVVRVC